MAKRGNLNERSIEDMTATTIEPDEPWYQLAGWWDGLNWTDVYWKIRTIPPSDWAVMPPEFHGAGLRNTFNDVDREFAQEIYMELTRKNGYSPTHAAQAWAGARDFKAKGETE